MAASHGCLKGDHGLLAAAAIDLLQSAFGAQHKVIEASDPLGGHKSREAFPDWVKAEHLVEGINIVTVYVLLDNRKSNPVCLKVVILSTSFAQKHGCMC